MFDITVEGTKVDRHREAGLPARRLKGMRKDLRSRSAPAHPVHGELRRRQGRGARCARTSAGSAGDELDVLHRAGRQGADQQGQPDRERAAPSRPTSRRSAATCLRSRKDVIAESSQGGGQESVDGKVVHPGQKVEYQLTTEPKLPADLATTVTERGVHATPTTRTSCRTSRPWR